jgi:hypothetical protein
MRHIVQLANVGVLISDLALLGESLNQLVLAPFCEDRWPRQHSERDDRNVRLLVSHAAQRLPPLVDRPVRVRDGYLFKNANPALRTGLLSPGPCGTDFSNHQQP